MLDSTDPAEVLAVERSIDLDKTLFVVSSKSGATIETLSHYRYFSIRSPTAPTSSPSPTPAAAGRPGRRHGFRRVFENDPTSAGATSVLSYFGLVPAALMGIAVDALLHRAQVAEAACAAFDSSASNAGLWLGLVMGELARQGRDKVTFVVSAPVDAFGLWVEQLVAESTGKEGRGILPVAGEPVGSPEAYGDDRVFAYLRRVEDPDADLDLEVKALGDAGHPTVTLSVHGPIDLGRIFFFAEFAIAVAGWVLEINPFDQPNVQEAKDNTNRVLEAYAESGALPGVADADDDALRALLGQGAAALPRRARLPPGVGGLRRRRGRPPRPAATQDGMRDDVRLRAALPALHRPVPQGRADDRAVPAARARRRRGRGRAGRRVHFGTLKNAAATGDLQTLRDHGLPAERVRLEGDPVQALRALTAKLEELL